MKKILITSFDMEVGGVERSLISLLENLDYSKYDVDLILYSHTGEFMKLLPQNKFKLLVENHKYSTFRKSISQVLKEKNFLIALARILAIINSKIFHRFKNIFVTSYYQMQLIWKYSTPFLPSVEKEYDVAISYLWPHNFVSDKVKARKKIAWIHTDYSKIDTDIELDLKTWEKFDNIIAVSKECKNAFINKYSYLESKIEVIENMLSQEFINKMANEEVEDDISKNTGFKLLTVARFCEEKGIDMAVKALKILHNKGMKDISWYLIGYGGYEEQIKLSIEEMGLKDSFIILGKKVNPYPYMKVCDVYVQPSRYEGKAVTVVEAQILKKPVLITNYTTAKSQVNDKVDGVICDLSVNGIVKGVEELYKNKSLRNSLSENCSTNDFGKKSEIEKLYELM